MAKEWIKRVDLPVYPEPIQEDYLEMDRLSNILEAPMPQIESELDKKIRILELLSKLTS
jgi:hypothetical protein